VNHIGRVASRVNEEIVLPRPATVKSYWLPDVVEYSLSGSADLLVFGQNFPCRDESATHSARDTGLARFVLLDS
jgi:hypothetical protein